MIKDPSLLKEGARGSYADLPGGHSEGYETPSSRCFRRFLPVDRGAPAQNRSTRSSPTGCGTLTILEAEMESHRKHAWGGCGIMLRDETKFVRRASRISF